MRLEAAIEQIESKYRALASVLDERARRQWAASEAKAYGWGGVTAMSGATGLAPNTIRKGLLELAARQDDPHAEVSSRLRKPGGGRKRLTETDPRLSVELDRLVAPLTRDDPMSPLRWTCKSTSHLAQALTQQGHPISARAVAQLLNAAGYSLQSNRKTLEGSAHPDRNAQFEHINAQVARFQQRGQPVISVDTKRTSDARSCSTCSSPAGSGTRGWAGAAARPGSARRPSTSVIGCRCCRRRRR